jgi:hypothetical protein
MSRDLDKTKEIMARLIQSPPKPHNPPNPLKAAKGKAIAPKRKPKAKGGGS